MKQTISIILSLILLSCTNFSKNRKNLKPLNIPTKEEFDSISIEIYQVKNIDSITYKYNNIFYVERNGLLYKVVSKKENIDSCERIIIGKYYNLKIPKIESSNSLYFGHVDGETMYEFEPVLYERGPFTAPGLYITPYIRGVCYIND